MRTIAVLSASFLGVAVAQTAGLRGSPVLAKAPKGEDPKENAEGNDVWYIKEEDKGLWPNNTVFDEDDKHFTMTVQPYQEATRIRSKDWYTGGKFSFKIKSASVEPGIITSVYLSSDNGRKSDTELGTQDELDLEWKGNDPKRVQTNLFLHGIENLKLIDLPDDSSKVNNQYALEWDEKVVKFWVANKPVRAIELPRALKPMQLHMSVWTTMGGWPGLIQWAGPVDWQSHQNKPISAEFEILELPTAATEEEVAAEADAADTKPDATKPNTKPDATKPDAKPKNPNYGCSVRGSVCVC